MKGDVIIAVLERWCVKGDVITAPVLRKALPGCGVKGAHAAVVHALGACFFG